MSAIYRCAHLMALFVMVSFYAAYAQKPVPELWGHRIHDEAHVLTQATLDSLERSLEKYEDSTSNQIAVLLIPSLDGEVLEEYALRVAEQWKLGQKDKDNGALLLVAVNDRKMRIEVGQGLEGVLTDAQSSRIIRDEIAPHFRRSDYDGGITAGVDAMIRAIGGEYQAESANTEELTFGERIAIGVFVFFILGIFTTIALFSQGCAAWGLYVFLIPFYAIFPWISIGTTAAIVVFIAYVVGFPIAKAALNRSPSMKKRMMKWKSTSGRSGGAWILGSGSSRGGGWSSGSFSGGGGSFGGGGSSGSW